MTAEPAQNAPSVARDRHLPDRLSLIRRVELPCGCIRAVDSVSGLAVMERECQRARP